MCSCGKQQSHQSNSGSHSKPCHKPNHCSCNCVVVPLYKKEFKYEPLYYYSNVECDQCPQYYYYCPNTLCSHIRHIE